MDKEPTSVQRAAMTPKEDKRASLRGAVLKEKRQSLSADLDSVQGIKLATVKTLLSDWKDMCETSDFKPHKQGQLAKKVIGVKVTSWGAGASKFSKRYFVVSRKDDSEPGILVYYKDEKAFLKNKADVQGIIPLRFASICEGELFYAGVNKKRENYFALDVSESYTKTAAKKSKPGSGNEWKKRVKTIYLMMVEHPEEKREWLTAIHSCISVATPKMARTVTRTLSLFVPSQKDNEDDEDGIDNDIIQDTTTEQITITDASGANNNDYNSNNNNNNNMSSSYGGSKFGDSVPPLSISSRTYESTLSPVSPSFTPGSLEFSFSLNTTRRNSAILQESLSLLEHGAYASSNWTVSDDKLGGLSCVFAGMFGTAEQFVPSGSSAPNIALMANKIRNDGDQWYLLMALVDADNKNWLMCVDHIARDSSYFRITLIRRDDATSDEPTYYYAKAKAHIRTDGNIRFADIDTKPRTPTGQVLPPLRGTIMWRVTEEMAFITNAVGTVSVKLDDTTYEAKTTASQEDDATPAEHQQQRPQAFSFERVSVASPSDPMKPHLLCYELNYAYSTDDEALSFVVRIPKLGPVPRFVVNDLSQDISYSLSITHTKRMKIREFEVLSMSGSIDTSESGDSIAVTIDAALRQESSPQQQHRFAFSFKGSITRSQSMY